MTRLVPDWQIADAQRHFHFLGMESLLIKMIPVDFFRYHLSHGRTADDLWAIAHNKPEPSLEERVG